MPIACPWSCATRLFVVSRSAMTCTSMRPWLMVLGAFAAAAGGAFIAIANERRRRAPSAASLLAVSRRRPGGPALVEKQSQMFDHHGAVCAFWWCLYMPLARSAQFCRRELAAAERNYAKLVFCSASHRSRQANLPNVSVQQHGHAPAAAAAPPAANNNNPRTTCPGRSRRRRPSALNTSRTDH